MPVTPTVGLTRPQAEAIDQLIEAAAAVVTGVDSPDWLQDRIEGMDYALVRKRDATALLDALARLRMRGIR